jgi:hypothetical protein
MSDDAKDIGAGLAYRAQQTAAVDEMHDEENHPRTPAAKESSPYAKTPQEKVAHQRPAPKGEKEMYKKASDWTTGVKLYDKGGKVNVNDGQHQLAVLKDGERVLTEKQNSAYEKHMGVDGKAPTTLPVGGKTMRDKNDVTPEIKPSPKLPLFDEGGECHCFDDGGMVVHSQAEKDHFHRAMSHLHQGGLHDHFGMKHDAPISMAKKQEAANSDNPHVAAMGQMAVNMAHWHHKHAHKK